MIDGWLKGTVTAGSPLNLAVNYNTWVFDPESAPPFPTFIAPFRTGTLTNYLDPSNGSNGQMIQGTLNNPQSVPEPSTLVCFACISALLVYRLRNSGPVPPA